MLNAFNNDIEYKNLWYHIQTEDNGRRNGHITTTVFHSGQTLDCKSTSYLEYVRGITDENEINKIVKDRMVEQHQFFYKKLFDGDYDAKVESMYQKSASKSSPMINLAASNKGAASQASAALPVPSPRASTVGRNAVRPDLIRTAQPEAPAAGPHHSASRISSPKIVRPASSSTPHAAKLTRPLERSAAVKAAETSGKIKPWAGVAWPSEDLALDTLVAALLEGQAV